MSLRQNRQGMPDAATASFSPCFYVSVSPWLTFSVSSSMLREAHAAAATEDVGGAYIRPIIRRLL